MYDLFNINKILAEERQKNFKRKPMSLEVLKLFYKFENLALVEVVDDYVILKNKWQNENDKFQVKCTVEDAISFKKEFDEYNSIKEPMNEISFNNGLLQII